MLATDNQCRPDLGTIYKKSLPAAWATNKPCRSLVLDFAASCLLPLFATLGGFVLAQQLHAFRSCSSECRHRRPLAVTSMTVLESSPASSPPTEDQFCEQQCHICRTAYLCVLFSSSWLLSKAGGVLVGVYRQRQPSLASGVGVRSAAHAPVATQ